MTSVNIMLLHACFIFRISYSFLNWLDSSVCWKNPSSKFPSAVGGSN